MKKKKDNMVIFMTIILIFIIGFLFLSSDGRCILKGGQLIDSYVGIQECHSTDGCSHYKSRICIDEEGDTIP